MCADNSQGPADRYTKQNRKTSFGFMGIFIRESTGYFDFGVVKQTLHCSHAASTDDDLTSQVVRPVSALLAWYLVAHRTELVGKTVVEWVLVRGSVGSLRRSSPLTDGNEIVLKLLTKNVGINAELRKVHVLELFWGDHQSVEHFERAFVHPVDVLHGADVVCWPVLVNPIMQTIKYLLMRSRDPLKGTFCFHQRTLLRGSRSVGLRVQEDTFIPKPRPANLTYNLELQLLVFTLDSRKPNWNDPLFSIHIKEVDVHRSITQQAMEINQHRLPHDIRFANNYKLNTRSNVLQFYVSNAITIGLV
ncbi:hypothetical protein PsorP6_012199 [Peronosclerospora sorghi]|uniref:Uncharacterized protein n=1 Tax=Peronosclerospora sorghi TaxID=230839 RepID=A0ACC0WJC9_9STRA|nr:hypothetical protein PsorP6_012199 [Peronosclerospora sorghi]